MHIFNLKYTLCNHTHNNIELCPLDGIGQNQQTTTPLISNIHTFIHFSFLMVAPSTINLVLKVLVILV